ncbi:PA0069 family radical SAM protein [Cyclobacterium jeungdonense]|uniref:PA0069 family radical SAM protein n=1 Tax=Cyclobacterium jeungdonense TaxID=708087 RepID=A0ABT8CAW2_9BACT|nr:PA0069 family radical SAM protein [Cyclobacterium jeungdonense]MDN3689948.1 PA0069 family radical SAM protein [Cyclobacterium jeungdonense]
MKPDLPKGRGTGSRPDNLFKKSRFVREHPEGIDAVETEQSTVTEYLMVSSKTAISTNDSPDITLSSSVNPYQGCEHGCIYCYARNSHTYWGYDSGLGFESKILVKKDIVSVLRKEFEKKKYQPQPIMLSGNTDCYQPAERKFKLTAKILELCLEFSHPVSVITKNGLIERDQKLLKSLAEKRLVHVYFSINHLDPRLKQILEPRTATARKKIELIRKFSEQGIPCGIMVAPLIPGINTEAMPEIIREAAAAGARKAGYTVVRLNGQLKELFLEWMETHFPERKNKVMHQIESLHAGHSNDTEWGRRIKGDGVLAQTIAGLFRASVRKYMSNGEKMPEFDLEIFKGNGQLKLF